MINDMILSLDGMSKKIVVSHISLVWTSLEKISIIFDAWKRGKIMLLVFHKRDVEWLLELGKEKKVKA